MNQLRGTTALSVAIIRRDRVRIAVWLVSLVALVLVTAVSTKDIYPTQHDLDRMAALTSDNPAALAFNGPPIALNTMGGQIAFQLGAFGLSMVGLMTLLLTGRFTRGEEEAGRTELLRALPVGRHAPLAAASLVVVGINLVMGALTALLLVGEDLPVAGSVAIGLSFLVIGVFFLGVTAVTAQISENARVTGGLAGAVLGMAYVVRAIGDGSGGTLSWLSPIGVVQKVRAYGGEDWWTLVLATAIGVALMAGAVAMANRRDFGSGMFPPRPGPAHAAPSLGSELGLAIRMQRASALWWLVGTLVMAGTMGSLAGSIQDFITDSDTFADYFAVTGTSITDGYLATCLLLQALIPAGAAVQMLLRIRGEELSGRGDAVLATPATRSRWLGGHLTVVLVSTTVGLLAGGIGLGISAALSLGDAGQVARLTGAAAAYLPALWLLTAVTVAFIGLLPRASYGAWAAWSLCLVIAYFGTLFHIPRLVIDLSPFQHVPLLPAQDLTVVPLVALTSVAAVFFVVGGAGLRRRDIG